MVINLILISSESLIDLDVSGQNLDLFKTLSDLLTSSI